MYGPALSPQPNKEKEVRRKSHIPLSIGSLLYIALMYPLCNHRVNNKVRFKHDDCVPLENPILS